MELKLLIDDKEKIFVVPFVKARMFRRALEVNKEVDFNNLNEDSLDKLVDFVVDVYGGKFSREQFYDGLAADKLVSTIVDVMGEVVGKTSGESEPGK